MKLSPKTFENIVILTGAGISADSGISTFRDSNGLWENHHIEDVATPEAWKKDPELVWKFYSMRRSAAARAQPNKAHQTLVNFKERNPDKTVTLITQNIDDLHLRVDPHQILSPICMHGSLNQSRCCNCENIYYDDYAYFDDAGVANPQETTLCTGTQKTNQDYLHSHKIHYYKSLPLSPCCRALLRPHIVWFGEVPLKMGPILESLENADLFISIGTSGAVYPAAGFLQVAKEVKAKTVCLNLEPIPQNRWIDEFIQGRAIDIVPEFFS